VSHQPTASAAPFDPWAVYVHVPFCGRRCAYCDFATSALPRDTGDAARLKARYVEAVLAEIAASPARPARTVYFGGGTPTQLSAEQLLCILQALRNHGSILPDAEITVEANPTTAESGLFAALRDAGVNRLSMGFQSLDDRLLGVLGRTHTAAEAVAAYRLARAAGFENVSLDLMFNLPGQTLDQWREDLAQTVDLGPEHLSLYSLTIEEGAPFHARAERGELILPEEDVDAAMFEWAHDWLPTQGYGAYEISNFARPGAESRHNSAYWRNEAYRGYGPGAASYVGRRRFTNHGDLERWRAGVFQQIDDVAESEQRDDDGERRETMYLGLRRLAGVDVAWYERRYGAPPEAWFADELARCVAAGWLERTQSAWRLTRAGLLLANRVFMEFV